MRGWYRPWLKISIYMGDMGGQYRHIGETTHNLSQIMVKEAVCRPIELLSFYKYSLSFH
jgi:hypothetical protein